MDSTVLVAIITSCMAFLGVVFTAIFNAVTAMKTRQALDVTQAAQHAKLVEKGLQCLLRAELIRIHDKYMAKGIARYM